MKPSTRWTIAALAAIAIGIILFFWTGREEPQAPAKDEVAVQPAAPKPEPQAAEPLTATVLFDYNRSELRPGEAAKLDDFTAKLEARTYDQLDAVGHADRIGSDAHNLALSGRRAEAVRDYLAGKGVDAKRVRTDAGGEGQPATGEACRNMGPENRKNRKLVECMQPDRRAEVRLR
ncbi:MAG: OmpA family protein [Burkholderiales bacterium]